MSGTLIDTNILVYVIDNQDARKREACKREVDRLIASGQAVISNQVLAELFSVLTSKIGIPLPSEEAARVVRGFAESPAITKLTYTAETVVKAANLSAERRIPFWDALLAATMLEAGVFTICTEDEKDFSRVPGLKVVNPLQ
ncbi:MAG: PIN domain-containing protein [Candidatus Aenigmarchaeota archaeon]|nr:PIN domain-containing protein [Candidatus Aenigmarchaeota archaeon]